MVASSGSGSRPGVCLTKPKLCFCPWNGPMRSLATCTSNRSASSGMSNRRARMRSHSIRCGVVDSPIANRGCDAASTRATLAPCRARIEPLTEPARPEPRITTSTSWTLPDPLGSDALTLLGISYYLSSYPCRAGRRQAGAGRSGPCLGVLLGVREGRSAVGAERVLDQVPGLGDTCRRTQDRRDVRGADHHGVVRRAVLAARVHLQDLQARGLLLQVDPGDVRQAFLPELRLVEEVVDVLGGTADPHRVRERQQPPSRGAVVDLDVGLEGGK